jgi:phosphate/sulfate permease
MHGAQQKEKVETHPLENAVALGVLLIVVVAVVAVGLYVYNFRGFPWSSDPGSWGQFGDYVGGLLNPLVATAALMVLLASYRLQKRELAEMKRAMDRQTKIDMGLRLLEQTRGMIDSFQHGANPGQESFATVLTSIGTMLEMPVWFNPERGADSQFDNLILKSNWYSVLEPFGLSMLHIVTYLRKLDGELEAAELKTFSLARVATDHLGISGSILLLVVGAIATADDEKRETCKYLLEYVQQRSSWVAIVDVNVAKFWATFGETFASRFAVTS